MESAEIAIRLRELRAEAGLTREAVAFRSGLSVASVVRAEGGRTSPSTETLSKLATAYGITLAELVEVAA